MTRIDFSTPAAGFDQPLELWLACHQRVLRFTALLPRLAIHLQAHGADGQAQGTAASIRRYFNEAAPRHHADEEEDLFPLLRTHPALPDRAAVQAAMAVLEAEHVQTAALWHRLDTALAQVEAGTSCALDADLLREFGATYAAHIELEEGVVLPALRAVLQPADVRALGISMARRRGANWDDLAPLRA